MQPKRAYYLGFIFVLMGIICAIYCLINDSLFFSVSSLVCSVVGVFTMAIGLIGKD